MDYSPQTGSLTFAPGQTTQEIQIQLKQPKRGDIDGDGDIDRDDVNLLLEARNTPANPPQTNNQFFSLKLKNISGANFQDDLGLGTLIGTISDPRDVDGDGRITVLDARQLVNLGLEGE